MKKLDANFKLRLRYAKMKNIEKKFFLIFKFSFYSFLFLNLFNLSFGAEAKTFNLSQFNGALVFQYQSTIEEEYNFDDLVLDINRSYFEGGLELKFGGSIYHPNFITFQVDLNLIANKIKNVYFSDESINNSLNNTYNINLHFLKKKTTNFQIYALDNYRSADRRFSERFFTNSNLVGVKLKSSNKLVPFSLDVFRHKMFSESILYTEREEQSDNIDFRAEFSKFSGWRSNIRLKTRNYSEKINDTNYKSLNIFADVFKYYGNQRRNSIFALISYRKMSEDINQEILGFDVNHRQYIKNNIHFFNTYKYLKNNSPSRNGDKHVLMLSVNHQLFNSLNSKIRSGGRLEDSIYQKIAAISFGLELNYKKKIPIGFVHLGYQNNRERGDYTSKSEISFVNELFSFTVSDSIILVTPGINPQSIRVTDNEFTFLYVEGVDYQIDIMKSIITIIRIPGGAIQKGSSVYISYDFLSFPDYKFRDNFEQWNFNLNIFKYFHLFYRSNSNNQLISSDFLVVPFQSYSRIHYGMKIVSKYINSEYSLENYESDVSSHLSKNFRLSLSLSPFSTIRISGSANINRLEYISGGLFINFDTYYGNINFRPNRFLSIDVYYRDMRYENQNYIRDRESVITKVRWNFRKIILEIFYEYLLNNYSDTYKSRNYLTLRFRRMF